MMLYLKGICTFKYKYDGNGRQHIYPNILIQSLEQLVKDCEVWNSLAYKDAPLDNENNANDIYLNYGFDVRICSTTLNTEVTDDKCFAITIAENPCVSIHISYVLLICLGSDSPNLSVQSFNGTTYRED